jgi:hypothetical protein
VLLLRELLEMQVSWMSIGECSHSGQVASCLHQLISEDTSRATGGWSQLCWQARWNQHVTQSWMKWYWRLRGTSAGVISGGPLGDVFWRS